MSRKEELLKPANDAQKAVIRSVEGKYLVLSTAGSGKTFAAVTRTAYMLECGISADQILMFTFTKKAANEMKTRIEKLVGSKAKGITISTYHSFCGKLLRQYAQVVDLQSNFTIYDEEDSFEALRTIIASDLTLKDIDVKDAKNKISLWKEHLVTPEEAVKNNKASKAKLAAKLYKKYYDYLRKSNAVDFDDLTYFAVKALEKSSVMQQQVNDQYRYIVSDESQDSSRQNLKLISLLAGPNPDKWNLMMFCDESQSIYSFRGADVSAFIRFIEDNKLIKLVMGQNYRSTKTIVNASAELVKKNVVRIDKEIFTENEEGSKIGVFTCEDTKAEAKRIASLVKKVVQDGGWSYKNVAVLYRIRSQSQPIEAEFTRQGIPHRVKSGGSFFSRKVIKDILGYVRLVVNPNDREAFRRVINVPNRFVGPASLAEILIYLEQHDNVSLFDACRNVRVVQSRTRQGINNFLAVMHQLCDIAQDIEDNQDDDDVNVSRLIREVYNITDYEAYAEKHLDKEETMAEIKADISQLINIASEYKTVASFINSTSDQVENEEDEDKPAVTLMTMHGAKGLEWPVVIVAGCNEGTAPFVLAVNEGNIEEERRLFFVALTRAMKMLFLTRAKEVMVNGRTFPARESRFIKELPAQYVKKYEAKRR